MKGMTVPNPRDIIAGALCAASVVALAVLVLVILSGATDRVRGYAALMETQVREQLWLPLMVNPLAWAFLIFIFALVTVVVSLVGFAILLLRPPGGARPAEDSNRHTSGFTD